MRMILTGLAISAGLYLVLLLLVYVFQRQFLYFPDHSVPTDGYLDKMGVTAVGVSSGPDGELRSLWRAPKASDSPVILFFHGNAGSHFHRIPIYQALASDGAAVLGVGYPGYGGNAGTPNEAELFQAAQANYDWLIQNGFRSDRIIIIGESLGSGVAAQLASQNGAATVSLIPCTLADQRSLPKSGPYRSDRYAVDLDLRNQRRIDPICCRPAPV